ncbi:MAG TPA: choice-of-anchor D domain-containing protein, partial [Candidatus Dormibacteraeota bacterium]|nr:choice-of-anchor D domain-containing protein [Candidatus Dormibacteraeota bacterium]
TSSTNFPTTSANAFQAALPAGNTTGTVFVSKIDTTKTGSPSLIYSTYLGGAGLDIALAAALGPNNVAYVTGTTSSTNFPTMPAGAFQTTGHANGNAFVSLIDTGMTGSTSLKYSTYLGGTGPDTGYGIRADASGNAYVAGTTSSKDFPFPPKAMVTGGFEPNYPANALSVGFFSKLNPAGGGTSDLLYSTYFGGVGTASAGDHIYGIAIDSSNPANAYVTGQTFSSAATFPVFPTTTAFQTTLNGPSDAFAAKLTPIPTLAVAPTSLSFGTVVIGTTSAAQTVTLTNNTNGAIAFTSATISGGSPAAANTDYAISANTCSTSIGAGASCTVSVTFKPSVAAAETAKLVLTDGDSTSPQNVALTGTGSNPPPDFTLNASPNTLTVAQGAAGTSTISVNPVNGFTSGVTLNCTGAPANSTCMLNPTSITAPTTSTLTFTAHAMLVPLPISKPAPPLNLLRIMPLFVAAMLVLMLQSRLRQRTRLAIACLIVICITLAACGSGGPAKPAKGTYPLTVTGTSGSLSHSTTVSVTVN